MSEPEREDPEAARRNARLGMALFAFYCSLYGGFMLLNAFAPRAMELTLWGVNLAILYGMGLIVAAFLLALLYAWLCRTPRPDASLRASGVPPGEQPPRFEDSPRGVDASLRASGVDPRTSGVPEQGSEPRE